MSQDLQEFFHSTLKKAGLILKDRFGKKLSIKQKTDQSLCTEADLASEAYLIEQIQKNYPNDNILSEEAGLLKTKWQPDSYLWVIDPLDGTTNFAHHFEYFAVSVARCRVNADNSYSTVAAGIEYPCARKTYFAEVQKGCHINGSKSSVRANQAISASYLVTGFDFDGGPNAKKDYDIFYQIAQQVHAVRSTGAAALDLALVAEGVFSAFWQRHLQPWDRAAGALLVTEAGGQLRNYSAYEDFRLDREGTIAGAPALVKYLKDLFHAG